jgi:hypothetical protein
VVLVVLTVGCTTGGHVAVKSGPTPVSSPVPSPSPAQSPSPVALDLPLSQVSFSCRLPISTPDGHGAFISFPSGTVTFDAAANYRQNQGIYYDRAYSRWLPVLRRAVSPDGRHYAFGVPAPDQTKTSTVHVVDLATGIEHIFSAPTSAWFISYVVLDYSNDGIYLVQAYESPQFGLWLLNPSTGAITQVAKLDDVEDSAGNKIFWLGTINPGDPNPFSSMFTNPDQLDRYNLVDGSRITWLYRPGQAVWLLALDVAGHPIVYLLSSPTSQDGELVLVLDPTTERTILKGSTSFIGSLSRSITDRHGVWFGSGQGLYLYSDAKGLQKVSNQPGYPANGCF